MFWDVWLVAATVVTVPDVVGEYTVAPRQVVGRVLGLVQWTRMVDSWSS